MKRVLMINWDSYPNLTVGGVYTWAKSLIENMPDWEFTVISQLSSANSNGTYTLPSNVKKVIEISIRGSHRYEEFYEERTTLLRKMIRTTESIIEQQFLPLYEKFLNSIISDNCDPRELTELILELHKFLMLYDSKKCFEYYRTWEVFHELISSDPLYRNMGMKAALMAFQLIQRNIQILSVEVPKTDIAHSSIAWLPALIAICAKMENGCPIIVSEDGVAFRELLLQYNNYSFDEPSKTFWKSFALNVVRTIYYAADVITPVCHTNAIWAKNLGADPSKIRVIYNGVNTKRFRPIDVAREDNRPTVVCVARVDIFKDVVYLIQAIRYVKEQIPNIQCLIFGSSTDLEYSIRCVNMVRKLHLDDNVRFMGSTKEPEKAYNIGDIVAFSSITEGLPFAVLEAMACGKAVVASNVGGVREVLECSGLLVRSRRPSELAKGIIILLKDEKLRYDLGVAASKRVNSDFTIEKSIAQFRQLYENLAVPDETRSYAGLKTEAVVR